MSHPRRLLAAALAVMVSVVSLGVPAGAVAGFGDVATGEFYSEAVQWMVDRGITSGTAPGCFSPADPATRGEVATFLWREAGSPAAPSSGFADVAPGSFYADAVGWMVAGGLTTGTSATTFSPDRNVTRGEIAAFLWRGAGSPAVALRTGGRCGGSSIAEELAVAEARSYELLNGLRTSLGLTPLHRVATMDDAARSWSRTMDEGDFFRHSGMGYGENIAWTSAAAMSPEAAAEYLHQLWVDSPGHYANMTMAGYRNVGVGFWHSADGWHATHVFSY